jgi:hypothetical protein
MASPIPTELFCGRSHAATASRAQTPCYSSEKYHAELYVLRAEQYKKADLGSHDLAKGAYFFRVVSWGDRRRGARVLFKQVYVLEYTRLMRSLQGLGAPCSIAVVMPLGMQPRLNSFYYFGDLGMGRLLLEGIVDLQTIKGS